MTKPQTKPDSLSFTDNPVAAKQGDKYKTVNVDVKKVLESWQISLFSYEWMTPDGAIRPSGDLPEKDRARRAAVEEALTAGEALEKPILGFGLLETIEIGAGRATFLTLAAHGAETLPVHIPVSQAGDFEPFLA